MYRSKHSTTHRRTLRLVLCVLVLAFSTQHTTVRADSFAPIACSQCPARTNVAWSYDSVSELPWDPNCSGTSCPAQYTNNINAIRHIVANGFVQQFGFNVTSFETEQDYDYFEFGPYGGTTSRLTGTPAGGFRDFALSKPLAVWSVLSAMLVSIGAACS